MRISQCSGMRDISRHDGSPMNCGKSRLASSSRDGIVWLLYETSMVSGLVIGGGWRSNA